MEESNILLSSPVPDSESPSHQVRLQCREYTIGDVMNEIRQNRLSFERKLDCFKEDIMTEIDNKISVMKNEFIVRYKQLETKVLTIEANVKELERTQSTIQAVQDNDSNKDPLNNSERCIVVRGLPFEPDEDLGFKVATLLSALGEELQATINVVSFERLKSRGKYPGLVKIALESANQKVAVLRAKHKLSTAGYRGVYIKGSKPHVERVLENNMKTVLSLIPDGSQFRFTGSGKLIRKDSGQLRNSVSGQEQDFRSQQFRGNNVQVHLGNMQTEAVYNQEFPPLTHENQQLQHGSTGGAQGQTLSQTVPKSQAASKSMKSPHEIPDRQIPMTEFHPIPPVMATGRITSSSQPDVYPNQKVSSTTVGLPLREQQQQSPMYSQGPNQHYTLYNMDTGQQLTEYM